jgi:hypothetical protein
LTYYCISSENKKQDEVPGEPLQPVFDLGNYSLMSGAFVREEGCNYPSE